MTDFQSDATLPHKKTQGPYHLFGVQARQDDYFSPSRRQLGAVYRIFGTIYAKLAAWMMCAMMIAGGPLPKPLKVRFQLADGVRISGELISWDAEGIDGTFGRRSWSDLKADDVWRLHQRLMNRESAEDWVGLGRVLLLMSHQQASAKDMAERAFQTALRLDESAADLIQLARNEAAEAARKRSEQQKAAEAAKLRTTSPEAGPWPSPWPALRPDEQAAAALEMKAKAEELLQLAGLSLQVIETDHFLLYTDAPRTDGAAWAMQLERAYEYAMKVLGVTRTDHVQPTGYRGFWGKAVVMVFRAQDRLHLIEAESFQQLVPRSTVAIFHPVGPQAFIVAYQHRDPAVLEWELTRQMTLAVLHRYRTPQRLPAWANEGLAEYIASQTSREPTIVRQCRREAVKWIRDGGNINALLDLKYEDESWPGMTGVAPQVCGLVVHLMVQEQPQRFLRWIIAVKDGKAWNEALAEDFGTSRDTLIATCAHYYTVND